MKEKKSPITLKNPNRAIALGLFLFALIIYVRTLAPDLLYGDSGEFQTLAYTLGHTHSTGYPLYLLLARLVGFVPVGNLAWRINLFSALSASIAVSFVFLIARKFTHNFVGPILASLLFAVSYTFWSQAIIAEVYTPAAALIGIIIYLFLSWQENPMKNTKLIFSAAFITAVGLGIHASVVLLAPASVLFVFWELIKHRHENKKNRKMLFAAVLGTASGVFLLFGLFLLIDLNNPTSSFTNVMLEPSRSLWGLQESDLDTPAERIFLTITGVQWQDAMFPDSVNFLIEFKESMRRFANIEFSWIFLFISWASLLLLVKKYSAKGLFILTNVMFMLFFILNYHPPDKYLFFIPLYFIFTFTAGAGIGMFFEWLITLKGLKSFSALASQLLLACLFFVWTVSPFISDRITAIKTGTAEFVEEDYVFPAKHLREPRSMAILYLSEMPENGVLVMDWRALYATYFVAEVEGKNKNLQIFEAMPHGNNGMVADSVIEKLKKLLMDGHPVFATGAFNGLEKDFNLKKISGLGLFELSVR